MKHAVLFIGHGTRDAQGVKECHSLMAGIEARLQHQDMIIEKAFLELTPPDIHDGIANCMSRGATDITLVPLLLFAAGHWKRDIPEEVTAAMKQYPGVAVQKAEALGLDAGMMGLVAQRVQVAMHDASDAVLFVGRGNRDAEATASFEQFAEQLSRQHGLQTVHTAVLTGIGNTVEEGLERCVGSGSSRVVVVPYLLFRGRVYDELAHRTGRWAQQHATIDVVLTPYLWPHDTVIETFHRRIEHAILPTPDSAQTDEPICPRGPDSTEGTLPTRTASPE